MLFGYILDFFPFITLILLFLIPVNKGKVTGMAPWVVIIYIFIIIFSIALSPITPNTDKDLYQERYYNTLMYGMDLGYKDVGWIIYNMLCAKVFGSNIFLFWLTTAFVYVSSYYFFAKGYIDKRIVCYIVIMATGMQGFSVYGTNTLRQGFAMAIFLFAIRNNVRSFNRLLLLIIAVLFHKSMILLFVSLLVAKYLKNLKIVVSIWLLFLFFSLVNFDISGIIENLGFVDDRVSSYGGSAGDGLEKEYKVGFRWDFLFYSFIPLLFSYYFIIRKQYSNNIYLFAVRAYLLSNAIWLLLIRIPYTDRIAYLSWFMIPFLTLYPILEDPTLLKKPQMRVLQIMLVFMGVNIFLISR